MNISLHFDAQRKTCLRRGRTWLPLAATAILAGFVMSNAAWAAPHDPGITATVTPVPETVSLSRDAATTPVVITAQNTYASYLVSIQNHTTNALNGVTFSATTAVETAVTKTAPIESQSAYVVIPISPASPSCALTTATKIFCTFGTLSPGSSAVSFVVVVKAPTAGTAINVNWIVTGYEGNSSNGCCTFNATARTQLITQDDPAVRTELKSFVKGTGGTFFTGNTAVATAADPWTTSVIVPPAFSALYTTATILEGAGSGSCAPDLLTCNASTLTIPGTFGYLTITLRRDASTIKPGAKIVNAKVYYTHDNLPLVEVLDCTVTGGPQLGVPCMERRTAYTKKTAPTPEWEGDWEFVIRALDNGRYEG